MTTLVIGATGATGRLVVDQLLHTGENVRIIARSIDKLPPQLQNRDNLSIIQGTVIDMTEKELIKHVSGCDAIASCLGHNLSWKGIYGAPRKLVTTSIQKLCSAVEKRQSKQTLKLVLMNSTGVRNRDLKEPISFAQHAVLGLLRLAAPPHPDNEKAADYLRTYVSQTDSTIEWISVRPDALLNHDEVSPYTLHPSPIRSAIFNSGETSRINVAHLMTELITKQGMWDEWKGKMPVIYNTSVVID